jgi:hypothetical protein
MSSNQPIKKSKTNPLVQMLASLQKQPHEEQPYLLLMQYSRSFAQRQRAASSSSIDAAIYERAAVLTPAQRALRDAVNWLPEIIKLVTSPMVWVETIGGSQQATAVRGKQTPVVTLAAFSKDPLGWNNDDTTNLKNLQALATSIVEAAKNSSDDDGQIVIVFESILPLVTLHGLDRTVDFLRHLLKKQTSSVTLIVPILTETLTPSQHVILEDVAHAVLMLQGGEATLLRRGVRERANLLRESVPFEVDDEEGLQLLSLAATDDAPKKKKPVVALSVDGAPVAESPAGAPPARPSGRPGKVTLQHEDDDQETTKKSATKAAPKPQIYLQDDDPEFDDMDEEDPDDDLDI